ncbi:acylneuraminate cytidylyltransferase family protein [Bacillus sp. CGMCC 1.16541]|uniref:acylneuraminate cytidylyltransferase family protein n=1 Tax=Bacillus sp. CGMCC 1.16541 TaxID=2185143 RepID=UPI000D7314CB|nr:acylneuraminate cytidylyltransferase family protein [Bacillus sp. CGMCC 1.16541]
MYKGKKVIALIPARGGSKGIPYKNIQLLGAKPLIAWTIELAKSMPEIDKVVVSTDDLNISIVSQYYGADVVERPQDIAGDHAMAIDAVKHTIDTLASEGDVYDILVYLQPTSPFRSKEDIVQCLELLVSSGEYTSVATFSEADLNPMRAWKRKGGKMVQFVDDANPFLPRQQLPEAYQLNGAVYVFYTNTIHEKQETFVGSNPGGIMMPSDRSLDIDEEIDLLLAELMMSQMKHIR